MYKYTMTLGYLKDRHLCLLLSFLDKNENKWRKLYQLQKFSTFNLADKILIEEVGQKMAIWLKALCE